MLNIGLLRKRLTIQRRSTSQDEMGAQVDKWSTVGYAWGMIRSLTTDERVSSQVVHNQDTHEIVLRFFPGLLPADRVLYSDGNGKTLTWQLTSVLDDDERHRVMTCTALQWWEAS